MRNALAPRSTSTRSTSSAGLTSRATRSETMRAGRILVNMLEGKMVVEFSAASRDALEAYLKAENMHYDWILRIEWETQAQDGKLQIAQ